MGNHRSKNNSLVLTNKEIKLLQHKTSLSKSEIEEWHKQFIVN